MRLTPESEPNFKVRCSSGYQPVVVYDAGRQVYVIAQRLPGCEPEFALSYRVRRKFGSLRHVLSERWNNSV